MNFHKYAKTADFCKKAEYVVVWNRLKVDSTTAVDY